MHTAPAIPSTEAFAALDLIITAWPHRRWMPDPARDNLVELFHETIIAISGGVSGTHPTHIPGVVVVVYKYPDGSFVHNIHKYGECLASYNYEAASC